MDIDVVVNERELLGECPLWDERTRTLWWVDILSPSLKKLSPSGRLEVIPLGEAMGSFAFREKGGFVAGMKSGLYFFDVEKREAVAKPEADLPQNRFNDGRCDRDGRFWAGTMPEPMREPAGSLYRLGADRKVERKRSGITVPNSLAWSPDGRTMYFADSPRRAIWAFDYDRASGEPSNERVFATTQIGFPDGSCMDADGCLWNAEYGGSRVVRYTPQGRIDRIIEFPVTQPTSCCFGGSNLDTLYVTSATQRIEPELLAKQPLAGGLFAVHAGVTGLSEPEYGG
jgi:sugar lactone lactonase YvrE